jgi:hypothetical protein
MVERNAATDENMQGIIKGLEKGLGCTKNALKINKPIIFSTI